MMRSPTRPKAIPVPSKLTLKTLGPLTFGAGTFSGRYDNRDCDPVQLVKAAYELGIRQFDTSPYYGESETLLGNGLQALFETGVERDDVFVMTKCGRYDVWDFDYSPDNIVRSVKMSCKKLHVAYLDVVYLHDVEFVTESQVDEAAKTLFELKSTGLVRHVGISGYPLDVLVKYANAVKTTAGQSLDLILSYSQYNIQNTTLTKVIPRLLQEAGVEHVLSASPLSMGLLRTTGPPEWHPASAFLKGKVQESIEYLQSLPPTEQVGKEVAWTLPNVALGFALRHAPEDGIRSTVIGFTAVSEIRESVESYWQSLQPASEASIQARSKVEQGVRQVLGKALDETWQSPPEMARIADPVPSADSGN
ncbi:NADP-dependent oxidoreductase domain-containing protein [Protomyces lactucae-debilis]|uniref:NADP-dependent oxidoreductase domain-containing protein n=1 Tax=Protomyces lactucae-debilis TaxID=2754530 RepID=A0A1Y2FUG1_PROLT|nr:NADP-dependent oxidoreductase domain-containing protein [Protomyces lactucae-debilis]ORY87650.1 NADP-dependent oxidoreductase domain-containing protein [Protomyces lactucae-debilis]